jgi:Cdc6-like AAA superfamily ATPase
VRTWIPEGGVRANFEIMAQSGLNTVKPEFIFGREEEKQSIRDRLSKNRPFLVHGAAGVGKTLLLRSVLPEFSNVLYCENAATTQTIFRSVAQSLLRLHNRRAVTVFRDEESIKMKSAISLKGIVMDALNEGKYCIMLDHLKRPSYSLAAAVREVMGRGSTPVMAVARSCHMEDVGFLQPFYSDRSEKCEIRNFESEIAEQFAHEVVKKSGLSAQNMREFVEKVLQFSKGNPGAIRAMLEMAGYPEYRSEEHIKITPLYIDFRMSWNPL